jgi:hypothetical protein
LGAIVALAPALCWKTRFFGPVHKLLPEASFTDVLSAPIER